MRRVTINQISTQIILAIVSDICGLVIHRFGPDWNLNLITYIAMKTHTEMNPHDFGDAFPLMPPDICGLEFLNNYYWID